MYVRNSRIYRSAKGIRHARRGAAQTGIQRVGQCRSGHSEKRWATHGEPNDVNAHPQVSQSGRIALVHNGTIENYSVLKKALVQHGRQFQSETDTEVLVQLIEYVKESNGCSLYEAVKEALGQVEGAYAIGVVEQGDPDTLIVNILF